jgi:hypothetical protein
MGTYDVLTNGKKGCQVKIFHNNMKSYKIGDLLPAKSLGKSYTIVFPEYEAYKFAIVKSRKLWKLTDSSKEIIEPFIDKWGNDVKVTKKYNPSKRNNLDIFNIRIKNGWIPLDSNLD